MNPVTQLKRLTSRLHSHDKTNKRFDAYKAQKLLV